jgi:hypothetical protein
MPDAKATIPLEGRKAMARLLRIQRDAVQKFISAAQERLDAGDIDGFRQILAAASKTVTGPDERCDD